MAIVFDVNLTSTPSHTDAGSTTQTVVTTSAAANNSKLFCLVSWFHASATCTLAGGSLSWNQDVTTRNGSDNSAVFSADAPAGLASSTTLTATFSLSSGARAMAAFSLTGVVTGVTNDGTSSSTTGSGAWSTGTVNTVNANDVLVGFGVGDGTTTTTTPTGSYTEVHDFNDATSGETWESVYRIVSATGAYAGGGTYLAGTPTVAGCQVAYAQAVSGVPNPKPFNPIPFMSSGRI